METRDPANLRPHPLRAHIPRPADTDPAYIALKLSVRDSGVRESHPIVIDAHNHIVDGVWLWLAAKAYQLPSVPVVVVPDDQIPLIIVESLCGRKHLQAG